MPKIFISYRRSDSEDVAGRIYDRLADHFGSDSIFKDVDDIPFGVDFRDYLNASLDQCQVVLAVIGKTWLNTTDASGQRRLDNPADWVRLELEESLRRQDVRVVPLLVRRADLPRAHELPQSLAHLAYRNAAQARPDPDFHQDMNRLIVQLDEYFAGLQQREQDAAKTRDAECLRQQQAAELRQREEAERLKQQREQREQRVAAQQRTLEQEEAERLGKQQRDAEKRARQQSAARKGASTPLYLSRRRTLQLLGYGGSGLVLVSAVALLSDREPEPKLEPEASAAVELDPPEPIASSDPSNLSTIDFDTTQVDTRGEVIERTSGQVRGFREDLGNQIGLDMVAIPAEEFVMGSPEDEAERFSDEGPQRTVQVPAFFMGRFPVTQAQYEAVMGNNPAYFTKNGANRPVEKVSWHDAVAFCENLSQMTRRTYRLPSEAEWEYACRASTTTPFYFGSAITTELANYNGDHTYGAAPQGLSRRQTTEVGRFPPNAFGLYDMHGNIWEWCADHWHGNYEGAPLDGTAWLSNDESSDRLMRGGSWVNPPRFCRSAHRFHRPLDFRFEGVGFRVVCVLAETFS